MHHKLFVYIHTYISVATLAQAVRSSLTVCWEVLQLFILCRLSMISTASDSDGEHAAASTQHPLVPRRERRIGWDNIAYTENEFLLWYGELYLLIWNASDVAPRSQHPARQSTIASPPLTRIPAKCLQPTYDKDTGWCCLYPPK